MTRPPTPTLSPTVENYLKQLFAEQQRSGSELLPMGQLAQAMGVAPGTATSMVKTLADAGLVQYEPRDGVRLTAPGERQALNVIRRHRLVELFLVQVLGLDWSEVHIEAEELEHAISEKVLEKIDALLGHPQFDPHGDPIPGARGKLLRLDHPNLVECPLHTPLRLSRVLAQDAEFLQMLDRLGLVPGAAVVVESRDRLADAVAVKPAGRRAVTLGASAAAKILVEPLAG
jgi:DtxR family Mn-dependent transcriptional regulator